MGTEIDVDDENSDRRMRSRTVQCGFDEGKRVWHRQYCEHGFQFYCDQESKEEVSKMRVGNRRREKIEVRKRCVRRRLGQGMCGQSVGMSRESDRTQEYVSRVSTCCPSRW